jgi:hypothetical protein
MPQRVTERENLIQGSRDRILTKNVPVPAERCGAGS